MRPTTTPISCPLSILILKNPLLPPLLSARTEDDEQQNDAEGGARAVDRQRGRGRRNPHGKRCMSNNPIRNLFILKSNYLLPTYNT